MKTLKNIFLLAVSCFVLFLFSSCAPWYYSKPYYCVEWVRDESGYDIAYALKIRPDEKDKWEKLHREGEVGPVTGPHLLNKE
jgi:hypothetical protein